MTELDIDLDLLTETEALINAPGTWVEAHPHGVTDEGAIGGDVQAGAAWSRRFVRWVPAAGLWEVINDAFYLSACDHDSDQRVTTPDGYGGSETRCTYCGPILWITNQTECITCTDFRDPGSTEVGGDTTYDTEIGYYDWQMTDDYARECAAELRADRYGV